MAADLVLYGDIVTMHEEAPRAQALAVTGGRITAVGARTDVEELVGPDTRVVDVGGATVLPGFHRATRSPFGRSHRARA